jgi:tRNA threonylcarbamoyladenosine biosynthesis protein TsaB
MEEEDDEVIDREDREYNIEQIGVAVLILGLDTTTRAGSVALVRDGAILQEFVGDASRPHAQRLPGDVVRVCAAAGVQVREIERYAVAAGPGSFTGLRIGIAAIQGLAMAWQRLVVPVSTLEALALAAPASATRVVAWMDAQRGQVFAQVFDTGAAHAPPQPLGSAVSLPPAEALQEHRALLEGAVFVGDGAVKYRPTIAERLGDARAPAAPPPPLAGAIALLAWREPQRAVLPHAVVPIYVRRPDAELARDRSAAR